MHLYLHSHNHQDQYYNSLHSFLYHDIVFLPTSNTVSYTHLFIETGAFMITKSCFITSETRIGDQVELFELDGDEAIDIDTFGDLKQAENVLTRKKTAFYVNGNNTIGLGHISRVLQIADELFTKPDIYFDSTKTCLLYTSRCV